MLEILIVIALCRSISAKAKAKGRSGGGFGCLLVFLWIGGEIAGALAVAVLSVGMNGGGEPNMLFVYGGALAGAALGAVIAFAIVGSLAPVRSGRYDDDDDRDDDRPRRARDRDDRW